MQRIDDHLAEFGDRSVHVFEVIDGTPDDDYLTGASGADRISGFDGNDTIIAGAGADTLLGAAGDDFLSGEAGSDSIDAGDGNDWIQAGAGNDTVIGGSGVDTLSFGDGVTGVHADLGLQGQVQDTGAGLDLITGIENLRGTDQDDNLIGDGSGNVIDGRDASGRGDVLIGRGGEDLLVIAGGEHRLVNGGAGVDYLELVDADVAHLLDLSIKASQADGEGTIVIKGVENLSTGTDGFGADLFAGDRHDNILAAYAGDDQLFGGSGADLLLSDGVFQEEFGPTYVPHLTIQQEGASGYDTLDGGTGDDTLVGGGASDQLRGGGGVDTFLFLQREDTRVGEPDLILDLTRKDAIDISGIDADETSDGDQAFHLVRRFTGHAGELTARYDVGSDTTHFLMDVDGDGYEEVEIDASGDVRHFSNFVL